MMKSEYMRRSYVVHVWVITVQYIMLLHARLCTCVFTNDSVTSIGCNDVATVEVLNILTIDISKLISRHNYHIMYTDVGIIDWFVLFIVWPLKQLKEVVMELVCNVVYRPFPIQHKVMTTYMYIHCTVQCVLLY